MADNVSISAGTGTTILADELTHATYGTGKAQAIKLLLGAPNTGVDAVGGAGVAGTDTLRVAVATDDVNLAAIKTAVETIDNAISGAGLNITQIGGAAAPIGAGTEATALRVTLPTNGTGVVGLAAGVAEIGNVKNAGTFAVQAAVTAASGSIAAGAIAAGATSIAANEDDASADLDRGVKMLAVQKATPANTAGTDGDYEFLQMSAGRLWVSAAVTVVAPGTSATALGKAIDAAAGASDVGVATLAVRDDALSALTPVEGDWVPLRTDANGGLWVTPSGNITVNAHAVTVASGGIASGAVASGAFASGAIGSGAIASGAVASGAVASGAFASGSIASGAMVDLGAIADAAATAGSTGSIHAKQRLMTSQLDSIKTAVETLDNAISGSEIQADVLTVPTDPFGANADAASATGSISAKLRGIATALGVTAFDLGSGTGGSRTLRQFQDTAQWIGGAGAVTSAVQRATLASDDPAVASLAILSAAGIVKATTSFNRPADTTAYAANDAVSDNTTAGSVTELSWSIARSAGIIRRVRIKKTDQTVATPTIRLWLYDTTLSAGAGDNAAFVHPATDSLGYVDVPVTTAGSDDAVGWAECDIPFTGATIYGLLQTLSAFTPANAETFTTDIWYLPG